MGHDVEALITKEEEEFNLGLFAIFLTAQIL
jgi:hypothetical protein